MSSSMNLGKVEIWETSLDRIVTLREGAKGVLRPKKNDDRQLGLIPISRNLILTSDIAKLEAQQAGHRPCTSSRGRRCGSSGRHTRTPSCRFASGRLSSGGPSGGIGPT